MRLSSSGNSVTIQDLSFVSECIPGFYQYCANAFNTTPELFKRTVENGEVTKKELMEALATINICVSILE
jgi:hypothetical protein